MSEHADVDDGLTLLEALDSLSALRGEDPDAPRTVLLLAFQGWGDAAETATAVLKRIRKRLSAAESHSMSDERFYDYQVTRPTVSRGKNGQRSIAWPGVKFFETSAEPDRLRVILAYGQEPSFAWKSFADQFLAFCARESVDAVVLLGSLLADTPHSRPLPTAATSESRALRRLMGLDQSVYEGPTGMLGVLSERLHRSGFPTISVWVSVPHYVAQSPSPKAQLGLVNALEDLFGVLWTDADLEMSAVEWEKSVDDLASEDPDIRAYVSRLEKAADAAAEQAKALPQVSGEDIAEEIEEYLRSVSLSDDGSLNGDAAPNKDSTDDDEGLPR